MKHRAVRLVADPYPPYQFEEGGRIQGTDYETIRSIFEGMTTRLDVELCPWEECLRRVDAGEADGVFQITQTAERASRYLFSDLLRTEETAMFARTDEVAPNWDGNGCLNIPEGRLLGILEGYSYSAEVDRLPGKHKLLLAGQEELLEALHRGECDWILMDIGVAEHLCARLGIHGIRRVNGFAVRRDLYVAFRRGCEEIVQGFNHGLRIGPR